MKDAKDTIGSIIEGDAHRDAIHVAVAPCVAGEDLEPGTRVGFSEDGTVNEWKNNSVGIVDPFLRKTVKKGQKFWLFLYPGTALNLRHEWDNPHFRQPESNPSMIWLGEYATAHHMTLQDLLAGVKRYIESNCDDATLDDDFKDYEVPDIFWHHYQAVTGQAGKGNFWGCCI